MTTNDIRLVRQYRQTIAASPKRIFPLLCPVREADYLPHWQYRMVYSSSGVAEAGCVFATPAGGGGEITWMITEHQPAQRVGFAWVHPDRLAARLSFTLSPAGDGTELSARYEYTALSQAGATELAGYTDEWFAGKMKHFGTCLGHYLAAGRMLAI